MGGFAIFPTISGAVGVVVDVVVEVVFGLGAIICWDVVSLGVESVSAVVVVKEGVVVAVVVFTAVVGAAAGVFGTTVPAGVGAAAVGVGTNAVPGVATAVGAIIHGVVGR